MRLIEQIQRVGRVCLPGGPISSSSMPRVEPACCKHPELGTCGSGGSIRWACHRVPCLDGCLWRWEARSVADWEPRTRAVSRRVSPGPERTHPAPGGRHTPRPSHVWSWQAASSRSWAHAGWEGLFAGHATGSLASLGTCGGGKLSWVLCAKPVRRRKASSPQKSASSACPERAHPGDGPPPLPSHMLRRQRVQAARPRHLWVGRVCLPGAPPIPCLARHPCLAQTAWPGHRSPVPTASHAAPGALGSWPGQLAASH